MNFDLEESIQLLRKTPAVLNLFLSGLNEKWIHAHEGVGTWSAFDIVGHLIHGEKTDWIPRMQIILKQGKNRTFVPFDRFAQKNDSLGKSLNELLAEFELLRTKNLETLNSANLSTHALQLTGVHPDLGEVTLQQLLSTWVAHDLGHIAQICRVMAKYYARDVGPWSAYLGILNR